MPISNAWRERRLFICLLAALSITIMLFSVVNVRHLVPRRHRQVDVEHPDVQHPEARQPDTQHPDLQSPDPQHPGNLIQQPEVRHPDTQNTNCGSLFYADEILNCVNARTKLGLKTERERGVMEDGLRRIMERVGL